MFFLKINKKHTVFGDFWSTKRLVNNDISTFRTKSDLHSINQLVHTFQNFFSAFITKFDVFSSSEIKFVES